MILILSESFIAKLGKKTSAKSLYLDKILLKVLFYCRAASWAIWYSIELLPDTWPAKKDKLLFQLGIMLSRRLYVLQMF